MRATIRLYEDVEKGLDAITAYRLDEYAKWGIDGKPCVGIDYRINSIGGYVTTGLGIYGALVASKLPVNTYIDGTALSMGLVIAQAGKSRYMASHAIAMMHPVEPGTDSEDGAIDKMNESILNILAKRAKVSREELAEMVQKTTYLNANECLELGLVDEIFDFEFADQDELETAMNQQEPMALAKAICDYTNKLNFTQMTQKDVVAKAEYDALAKNYADLEAKVKGIDDLTNKVADLQAKLTTATETNKALEDQVKAFGLEKATNLVEDAFKAGKLKEEAKQGWIEQAVGNYEGTKTLLDGLNTVAKAPELETNKGQVGKITAAGFMAEINAKANKN